VEQRGNSIFNTYEGTHNHLAPGWEEVNKKKKRKLNRSLERNVISKSMDSTKEGELTEKTIEENVHHATQEDPMTMVINESNHHQNVMTDHHLPPLHSSEVRTLIPLQELQHESNTLPSIHLDISNKDLPNV